MSARSSGSGRSVSARSVTSMTSVKPARGVPGRSSSSAPASALTNRQKGAPRPPSTAPRQRGLAARAVQLGDAAVLAGGGEQRLRRGEPVATAAARQRLVADHAAVAQVEDRLVDGFDVHGVEHGQYTVFRFFSALQTIQPCFARSSPDARLASAPMAGYSGTPLPRKLGIKPGHRVLALGAPDGFADGTLGELPDGVAVRTTARGKADVIVVLPRPARRARAPDAAPARADGAGRRAVDRLAQARLGRRRPTSPRTSCASSRSPTGSSTTRSARSTTTWSGLRLVIRLRDR